jgi:hypothetical protein
MSAEKNQAGIELGLKQMTDRGWQAEVCLIQPDATAGPAGERRLGATTALAHLLKQLTVRRRLIEADEALRTEHPFTEALGQSCQRVLRNGPFPFQNPRPMAVTA